MKRFLAMACAAATVLSLSACAKNAMRSESKQVFAMDTVMNLTVFGGERGAIDAAEAEIYRLEARLSRTREGSEVAKLNENGGGEVSAETAALLSAASEYAARTGGAFDMTVAPLMDLWGFTKKEYRVPSTQEIAATLPLVGSGHVHLDGETVTPDAGTRIDLGGIVKGYASDRVEAILRGKGVASAIADLGGNLLLLGGKPDGGDWRVGVKNPQGDADEYAVILSLRDAFAVTSGGYQRFFESGGETYHHIVDPKSGYPARSDLLSVTVVANANGEEYDGASPANGTGCDALSTALFVMGEETALEFYAKSGAAFELVLVTADGRVVLTKGLEGRFTKVEGSGYEYEVVP